MTAKTIDPSKIKAGDLMAVVHFVKVEEARTKDERFRVKNLGAGASEFWVQGNDLAKGLLSADQYSDEKRVTRTELAERLISSYNRPLTVSFEKADGTLRVLRGRLVSSEPIMGRSFCEDFDIEGTEKDRLRLVDHRSLKSLVVDGTKYIAKK